MSFHDEDKTLLGMNREQQERALKFTQTDYDKANRDNSRNLFEQEIAELRRYRYYREQRLLAAALKPPPAKPSDV